MYQDEKLVQSAKRNCSWLRASVIIFMGGFVLVGCDEDVPASDLTNGEIGAGEFIL